MPAVTYAPATQHQYESGDPAGRRLWVTWQHPETRTMSPVGCLTLLEDGSWSFWYVRRALSVPGFRPFVHFPDLYKKYSSSELFPIFANRVMSPRRPDYPQYLEALDLGDEATPFDILARSSGERATDAIRVHPEPSVDPVSGVSTCRFLAHGVRHIDGAVERIAHLKAGDRLALDPEPDNPANPRALLLTTDGRPVGYVPDLLLDYVHMMRDFRGVEVRVDRVNPVHTPIALRLMCWLAGPWPRGRRPFSGPDFEPLVADLGLDDTAD